jgi:hypothetical protein
MSTTLKHMKRFYTWIEWSVLIPAFFFAACFVYVAYESMHFSFMLEWMEGQTIDVIQRVVDGKPLYDKPTLEYVPLIYPPYYFYVSAFVTLLTGGDFFPARLVSTVATLGTSLVLYHWLRREDCGWRPALIGAFLFLATYRLSGRWFDMSRVDSLFLCLTVLGLYLAVYTRGIVNALAAALVLTAAFFTKQTALVIAAPVLLAMLLIDTRHAITTGVALLAMVFVGIFWLDSVSDNWFSFYAFAVPSGHPMERSMLMGFWTRDIFGHVGIFFLMALAVLVTMYYRDKKKAVLFSALAVGFVGASYMSRLHSFGFINVLMPLHFFLALMVGLGMSYCRKLPRAHMALPVAGVLVLIELSTLMYNPSKLIPGEKAYQGGMRFLQELAAVGGDIFMPEVQYIQTKVGKKSYAFGMAAFDVLRSDLKSMDYIKRGLSEKLEFAIRSKRFSAIMPGRMIRLPGLNQYYVKQQHIPHVQHYVAGAIGRMPSDIYVPLTLYYPSQHHPGEKLEQTVDNPGAAADDQAHPNTHSSGAASGESH